MTRDRLRSGTLLPAELCALHAHPLAIPCEHCGDFVCERCLHEVAGARYCRVCIADGRVSGWLSGLRAELTGRRDGWAWLVLAASTLYLGLDLIVRRDELRGGSPDAALLVVAGAIVWLGAATLFWAGIRTGRIALLLAPAARALTESLAATGRSPTLVLGEALVGTVLALVILVDTRNRLFFSLEVDDDDLRALALDLSNPWARASVAAVLALWLAVPLMGELHSRVVLSALFAMAVIALGCGLIGLRHIDPAARPPVGGRSSAIGGSVLAAAWIALAFVLR
jgi:hypothetical protein